MYQKPQARRLYRGQQPEARLYRGLSLGLGQKWQLIKVNSIPLKHDNENQRQSCIEACP
jgi:hypothetical protein